MDEELTRQRAVPIRTARLIYFLKSYALALRKELDAFTEESECYHHASVHLSESDRVACVRIEFKVAAQLDEPSVFPDLPEPQEEITFKQNSVEIYRPCKTYGDMLSWSNIQTTLDADEIIVEILGQRFKGSTNIPHPGQIYRHRKHDPPLFWHEYEVIWVVESGTTGRPLEGLYTYATHTETGDAYALSQSLVGGDDSFWVEPRLNEKHVLYRSTRSRSYWLRPLDMFMDGRFTLTA